MGFIEQAKTEEIDTLIHCMRQLRDCVLKAKGNFVVDDLKAQTALRNVNAFLSNYENTRPKETRNEQRQN